MIKKLIILTGILLAFFCIQLFQVDIRLTFGQSIGYSSIPPSDIQALPEVPQVCPFSIENHYTGYIQLNEYDNVDINLLKEKIREFDDPYPFVNIDRYFYNYYFDYSA